MMQVSQVIWNDLVATQEVLNPALRKLMEADPEEIDQLLEREADQLEQTYPARAVLAFQVVAPLLIERKAITNWLVDRNRPDLRASIPEILTIPEAISLMTAEYRINETERKALRKMLESAIKKTPTAKQPNGPQNPPT